ncbi:unnamed protein product [Darwinula stevensoni]|uniref:PID domain-containing protein n=1 Tax=Darwinula stevensoni TaxID=69355 RepID=A0A7R9FSK9_9CRUS|nr:unnamed protein product [Darwinula stevensoni]CAG0902863.1 unnamed protein product [Darwinula stevensoni]
MHSISWVRQGLIEDWSKDWEPILEGLTFYVKYVGSHLVDETGGEDVTADAIKTIVNMAKMAGTKLERVALTVSLRGISVTSLTSAFRMDISIFRISHCTADAHYDHVFAFLATNPNETTECHAFLCPKRKMTEAVTLTVAQSFKLAFDCWSKAEKKKMLLLKKEMEEEQWEDEGIFACLDGGEKRPRQRAMSLNDPWIPPRPTSPNSFIKNLGFEDDFVEVSKGFSRIPNGHPMLDVQSPSKDREAFQEFLIPASPTCMQAAWDNFLEDDPHSDLMSF